MSNKVYKLKDNFEKEKLFIIGITEIGETGVYAKIVPQDIESDPVRALLINYYKNPKWINEVYLKNPKLKKQLKKEIGLTYDKNGELVMTDKFVSVIRSWVLQIDTSDDSWIGFTSFNSREPKIFYNSGILKKFCPEEIKQLEEMNLIEEIEVE